MEPTEVFSVRFDRRTKQILVSLLDQAIAQTSSVITEGNYSEEVLQQHEELSQVKRGLLYTRPDEVEEEPVPVEETEPTTTDRTGGVEMYKSQGRPQ